jgi:hypothetical protein
VTTASLVSRERGAAASPGEEAVDLDGSALARDFAEGMILLIYGYDYDDWPMGPAVEAFEQLARYRVQLGPRHFASFDGLMHPIHRRGGVFVWEIS